MISKGIPAAISKGTSTESPRESLMPSLTESLVLYLKDLSKEIFHGAFTGLLEISLTESRRELRMASLRESLRVSLRDDSKGILKASPR